ncbi:MAG TPA: hypothetical protein PKE19_05370 [Aestuariivirga sp.]|nr:hypothetical protein [Aestuariivirga sp.]
MRRLLAVTAAVLLSGSAAFSADLAPLDSGWFGQIHGGAKFIYYDPSGSSQELYAPYLNIGGKVAYEPLSTTLGGQLDLDYNFLPLNWIHPDVDASGDLSDLLAVAHITYRISDATKLGAYVGYERAMLSLDGGTFLDDAGLTDADINGNTLVYGLEAMHAYSDATWIEARLGIIDPMSAKISATNTAGVSDSITYKDHGNDVWLINAGLGLHHQLSQNFGLRGDLNYAYLMKSDYIDQHVGLLNASATGEYRFDAVPLTTGLTVGTLTVFANGESETAFQARGSLTWAFGGAPAGARGHLFTSNHILGDWD